MKNRQMKNYIKKYGLTPQEIAYIEKKFILI